MPHNCDYTLPNIIMILNSCYNLTLVWCRVKSSSSLFFSLVTARISVLTRCSSSVSCCHCKFTSLSSCNKKYSDNANKQINYYLLYYYYSIIVIITVIISFSAFFYSLDVFSLFDRLFLNNTELKIFGRHQNRTQDDLLNAQVL